jgi:hypothetical protein
VVFPNSVIGKKKQNGQLKYYSLSKKANFASLQNRGNLAHPENAAVHLFSVFFQNIPVRRPVTDRNEGQRKFHVSCGSFKTGY